MSFILDTLETITSTRHDEVEQWLYTKRQGQRPFLYSSVDLRHSGHKLAPVDTNLFPAGFNVISAAARHRAIRQFRDRLSELYPNAKRILILPENHTRNLGYLENVAVLSDMLTTAGYEVKVGNFAATETLALETLSGRSLTEYPLVRKGNSIETSEGFIADILVLNNDFTTGEPTLLAGVDQPMEPPFTVGWYNRRKTEHFRVYDEISHDFAHEFGFDPWLISALSHRCGIVNFHERKGIECVALGVEKVLHQVKRKYAEFGITDTPYVFVKADSGTYGMGIMTVTSGDELMELNKKTRNKMNVIKEGAQNSEVIIQEGIPTIDRVEDAVAEPMIYLADGIPVGGAYRINAERDALSNLNASGMRFAGMCDEEECDKAEGRITIAHCNFDAFGLVAALAALAASREVYGGLDIGFSI